MKETEIAKECGVCGGEVDEHTGHCDECGEDCNE